MKKQTLTWLAVTLLVAAAGGGAWLWQRQQNDDEVASLNERVENLQSQAERLAKALDPSSTSSSADATETDETSSAESAVPVVFDPPGRFEASQQQQLKTEVIEPHLLYVSDQNVSVAAYYVRETQVSNEYSVTAIFAGADNAYEGFLVGGSDGLIWTPTCLDTCEFSDEFSQKYPAIVERTQ